MDFDFYLRNNNTAKIDAPKGILGSSSNKDLLTAIVIPNVPYFCFPPFDIHLSHVGTGGLAEIVTPDVLPLSRFCVRRLRC